MSDTRIEEIERRLEKILPGSVQVRVTGAASVGAQRSTLFIDIVDISGGDQGAAKARPRQAVAQILGSPLAVSDVEIEARLMRDARTAGMVVPEVLAWDVEFGVVVAERIEGESIPRRILRLVEANAGLGSRLAAECGRSLALLHSLPADRYAALSDYRDPRRYVKELATTLDGLTSPHPTFRLGLNWLARNAVSGGGDSSGCVVHGDFRNGNLLVTDSGLSGVLDWELVHRGDAMEDLAWLCLRTWRFGNDRAEAGGFASRAELRAGYEGAGGVWREDAFHWWTVARTVWWGMGLARQAQAFINGEADSIVLAASGRRVVELEYDLLELLDASD